MSEGAEFGVQIDDKDFQPLSGGEDQEMVSSDGKNPFSLFNESYLIQLNMMASENRLKVLATKVLDMNLQQKHGIKSAVITNLKRITKLKNQQ